VIKLARAMQYLINTELSSHEETRFEFNRSTGAIKLGIDVHQDFYVVVEQMGGTNPKPAQRFHKQAFLHWAAKLKQSGAEMHAVYEACGFGFLCKGSSARSRFNVTWLGLLRGCMDDSDEKCVLEWNQRFEPAWKDSVNWLAEQHGCLLMRGWCIRRVAPKRNVAGGSDDDRLNIVEAGIISGRAVAE
jgi:hypothetical protein